MLSQQNHSLHRSDEDPIPVSKEGIAAHAHANNDGGYCGRYGGYSARTVVDRGRGRRRRESMPTTTA